VLIFFVARRLFGSDPLALWAAACLALTPAHLLYSRVAVDILFGLPFMLAWLYLLLRFEDQGNPTMLFASTCALGLSVYGYKSAELVAPTYLLLTCIAAYGKTRQPRSCGIALTGFLVAVAPFVVALALHPERYRTMVAFYHVYDRNLNPLQGLHDLVRYDSVGNRLGAYWGHLSPSFLFFFGDVSVPDSTRRAGVFLWPIASFSSSVSTMPDTLASAG
jgi:4-amino-4-deoxy-L-arabinose transferase-like glycosyltransferase